MSSAHELRLPCLSRSQLREVLFRSLGELGFRSLCVDVLRDVLPQISDSMGFDEVFNRALSLYTPPQVGAAALGHPSFAARVLAVMAEHRDYESPQEDSLPLDQEPLRVRNQPGSAYAPDWYVSRPIEEEYSLERLACQGMPVLVLAPERFGKTWFLHHILRRIRETEGDQVKVVRLSLRSFASKDILKDEVSFLREFALRLLCAATGRAPSEAAALIDERWHGSLNVVAHLDDLLAGEVLSAFSGSRLILALDDIQHLAGFSYFEVFLNSLRTWTEQSSEQPWSALRLILAMTLSPQKLVTDVTHSVFYAAEPHVRLGDRDFDPGQIEWLATKHGLSWSTEDFSALRNLIGGHPYLNMLALSEASRTGASASELSQATHQIYTEHLRHCVKRLSSDVGLRDGFIRICKEPWTAVLREVKDSLKYAGYVIEQPGTRQTLPRYRLYLRLMELLGSR